MWLFALISTAAAGPNGYYHPFDLGQESELFREASNGALLGMEEQSRAAVLVSRSLTTYRQSLDLLGDRAPEAERTRLGEIEKQYNREFAKLQAFADTVIEDVDGEFQAAVQRAVTALGATAVECEKEIPVGPTVPGMRGRTELNPDCKGDDLNSPLAKAIDADAELKVAVGEITSMQWPKITMPKEALDPVGGPRHLDVRDFFFVGARDAMKAIDRADSDARVVFEAAIEEGEDLNAHVAASNKLTADTAARRAAMAAPVFAAADGILEKWTSKGETSTGWCANPVAFGGCKGEEDSKSLTDRLLEEKKVEKALP